MLGDLVRYLALNLECNLDSAMIVCKRFLFLGQPGIDLFVDFVLDFWPMLVSRWVNEKFFQR